MMPETALLLFLGASLIVIVSPGPDNILLLTRGLTLGRTAALVSAAGANLGLVFHSLLAALGLSAVLASSAAAYSAVKYAGAVYLVYIGVKALLNRSEFLPAQHGGKTIGLDRVFSQAVLSNVLNPKIAIFFLAYLPQFASPGSGPMWPQLLSYGLTFTLLSLVVFVVLGCLSGALGGLLRSRPRIALRLNWLTGGVLVSLGLGLALSGARR